MLKQMKVMEQERIRRLSETNTVQAIEGAPTKTDIEDKRRMTYDNHSSNK